MHPLTRLLRLARDGYVLAELERREEERWLAADDDGLTLLVGLLGRLQKHLERPATPGQSEDHANHSASVASLSELAVERAGRGIYQDKRAAVLRGEPIELQGPAVAGSEITEALMDLHDQCLGLIERLEVLADREEAEAAGIEHSARQAALVRPKHYEPKPAPAVKPKTRSERAAAASAAAARAPGPQSSQAADGWCGGVVRYFNAITKNGTVVVNAKGGSVEMTIPAPVFEKTGLTTLVPNMRVKVRVLSRPDGRAEINGLELMTSRNEPAAATEAAGARRMDSIPANPHLAKLEHARALQERYPGW